MSIKEYKNLGKYGVINAESPADIPLDAFAKLQNMYWKDGRLRKLPGLVEKNPVVIGTDAVRGVYKSHQVVPDLTHILAASGPRISKLNGTTFETLYSGLVPDTQIEFLEVPPYVYFYSQDNQIRRFDGGATTYSVGESSGLGENAPRKYSRIIYNTYAGRYFGIGRPDNPDYLEFSEHTDNEGIEKWPTGNIQLVKSTNGDVPLEMDEFEGRITMFSKNSINSGNVVGVPANWSFDREKAQTGTIARRSVKRFGSSFLMLTPDFEVYLWPQDIFVTYRAIDGGKRQKRIKFNIDPNRAHLACAEIVENRYYYLSFESGSNEPDDDYHLWIYDIQSDIWSGPHKGYNIASMFWDKDTNLLICGGAGNAGKAGNLSGYVLEHRGKDIRNKKSEIHIVGSNSDYGNPLLDKRFKKIHVTAKHEGGTQWNPLTDSSPSAHLPVLKETAKISGRERVFGVSSLFLDGVRDFVSIPDHANFDFSGGTWTVECRIFSRNLTSANDAIFFQKTDNNNFIRLFVLSDGTLRIAITAGGSSVVSVISNAGVITENTWYEVAFVENGDTWKIFVNGIDVTASGGTDTSRASNYTGEVKIGSSNLTVSTFFDGFIDEFRISNIARYAADYTPASQPFTSDANTMLLLHFEDTGIGPLEVITNVDGAYTKTHAQRMTLEDPATDNAADASAVKEVVTKRGFIHDDKGLGNRVQVEFKHSVQAADLEISQFAIEYDVKGYVKEPRAA